MKNKDHIVIFRTEDGKVSVDARFDEETVWPDPEYLPEGFDAVYSKDLSALQDEEEDSAAISDY